MAIRRPQCGWRRASWRYIFNELASACVPWWVMRLGNKHLGWCWASCVLFKFHPIEFIKDGDTLSVTEICFDAGGEPYDYCGQYQHCTEHPCFMAVVKRRQAELEARG